MRISILLVCGFVALPPTAADGFDGDVRFYHITVLNVTYLFPCLSAILPLLASVGIQPVERTAK